MFYDRMFSSLFELHVWFKGWTCSINSICLKEDANFPSLIAVVQTGEFSKTIKNEMIDDSVVIKADEGSDAKRQKVK